MSKGCTVLRVVTWQDEFWVIERRRSWLTGLRTFVREWGPYPSKHQAYACLKSAVDRNLTTGVVIEPTSVNYNGSFSPVALVVPYVKKRRPSLDRPSLGVVVTSREIEP
jgi:hypothetical protein